MNHRIPILSSTAGGALLSIAGILTLFSLTGCTSGGQDSPPKTNYSSAVMIVEKGDQFPTVSDVTVTKMGALVILTPPSPHYVHPGGAIRWHAGDESIRVRFDQGGVTDPEGSAEKGGAWETHAVSATSGDLVSYPYGVWSPKEARE